MMTQARKTTYVALRRRLSEYHYTIADMARELLIGQRTIQYRFSGTQPWTLPEMYHVMSWLGLPHDQLHIYFPPDGGTSKH